MPKRSRLLGFEQIAPLADRRANRRSIGVVETVSILRGSNEWRYYFTIKEAVEHGELWFINDPDGGLIEFQKDGKWILPFWPHEDVAKIAGQQMNLVGEANPMPLDHWIDQVLDVDCRQADCLVALCPSDWHAEIKTADEVFLGQAEYCADVGALGSALLGGPRLPDTGYQKRSQGQVALSTRAFAGQHNQGPYCCHCLLRERPLRGSDASEYRRPIPHSVNGASMRRESARSGRSGPTYHWC